MADPNVISATPTNPDAPRAQLGIHLEDAERIFGTIYLLTQEGGIDPHVRHDAIAELARVGCWKTSAALRSIGGPQIGLLDDELAQLAELATARGGA